MSGFRSGFVALCGWTNVGKSTLLNRFVGEKVSAVADVPQTTRNRITGVCAVPDRAQVVFVDTPGFHKPKHRMNHAMIETARETLRSVDLVLHVIDASRGAGPGDRRTAELLAHVEQPKIGVLNKVDRVHPKEKLLPMLGLVVDGWGYPEAVPVSARTGNGCERLLERIIDHLPEGPPLFPDDQYTDQPERALAAEWIREKVLHHTREELPHATAVLIERWKDTDRALVEIDATILVERDSQKGIVIGKEGGLLRTIGSEARADLEALLDTRVMLRLWVRVRPAWRDDARTLHELGID
ncbi:hypothetical protein ABI59_03040 [Acidobacteria bacterium Mor1]|nr:hypothetical protein ABI59_03040 [Acidobacteria bacterium Mor1]